MSMQKPRPVSPGGVIGVVAPSSPVAPEALMDGVERLRALGYQVLVGGSVQAQHGHLAGTDAARAADFNRIWADPRVEAVICARGGYGAMRIIEQIDWAMVRANPKFFCGFSDITALHLAMAKEANLVTFHGPMVAAMGDALVYNLEGLLRAMQETGPLGEIAWPAPVDDQPPRPVVIRPGVAEGRLTGGNLTLLASLLGTRWEPDFSDAILVVEEVDEAPYRVDRLLMQLRLAGKLKGLRGVVFGDSPSCLTRTDGKPSHTLFEVLSEHLGDLGIPVLYGFPCGHTNYRATIPFGVMGGLDAAAAALTITEPALR